MTAPTTVAFVTYNPDAETQQFLTDARRVLAEHGYRDVPSYVGERD